MIAIVRQPLGQLGIKILFTHVSALASEETDRLRLRQYITPTNVRTMRLLHAVRVGDVHIDNLVRCPVR